VPTWTHEQTTGGTSAGPLAYGLNVKSGSLLVIMFENDGADSDLSGLPTDTRGTVYQLIRKEIPAGSTQRFGWYYGISPSAGANTVTFTGLGTSFSAVKAAEWSVDTGTISIDAENGGKKNAVVGTDSLTSVSVTASTNNSLVLGMCGTDDGVGSVVTAGTNWTDRNLTGLSGSPSDSFQTQSRILASAGSVQSVWTIGTATFDGAAYVAVFKVDGGGGGGGGDITTRRYQIRRSRMTSW